MLKCVREIFQVHTKTLHRVWLTFSFYNISIDISNGNETKKDSLLKCILYWPGNKQLWFTAARKWDQDAFFFCFDRRCFSDSLKMNHLSFVSVPIPSWDNKTKRMKSKKKMKNIFCVRKERWMASTISLSAKWRR